MKSEQTTCQWCQGTGQELRGPGNGEVMHVTCRKCHGTGLVPAKQSCPTCELTAEKIRQSDGKDEKLWERWNNCPDPFHAKQSEPEGKCEYCRHNIDDHSKTGCHIENCDCKPTTFYAAKELKPTPVYRYGPDSEPEVELSPELCLACEGTGMAGNGKAMACLDCGGSGVRPRSEALPNDNGPRSGDGSAAINPPSNTDKEGGTAEYATRYLRKMANKLEKTISDHEAAHHCYPWTCEQLSAARRSLAEVVTQIKLAYASYDPTPDSTRIDEIMRLLEQPLFATPKSSDKEGERSPEQQLQDFIDGGGKITELTPEMAGFTSRSSDSKDESICPICGDERVRPLYGKRQWLCIEPDGTLRHVTPPTDTRAEELRVQLDRLVGNVSDVKLRGQLMQAILAYGLQQQAKGQHDGSFAKPQTEAQGVAGDKENPPINDGVAELPNPIISTAGEFEEVVDDIIAEHNHEYQTGYETAKSVGQNVEYHTYSTTAGTLDAILAANVADKEKAVRAGIEAFVAQVKNEAVLMELGGGRHNVPMIETADLDDALSYQLEEDGKE